MSEKQDSFITNKSLENKSWIELCDEELYEELMESRKINVTDINTEKSINVPLNSSVEEGEICDSPLIERTIKTKLLKENFDNESTDTLNDQKETGSIKHCNESYVKVLSQKNTENNVEYGGITIKSEPTEINKIQNVHSIEKIIKTEIVKSECDNESTETLIDQKETELAKIANILSYAKVLSQGLPKSDVKFDQKPIKTEFSADTEDLSVTGYLDIFHVNSPCKDVPRKAGIEIDLLDEDTVMYSPCKGKEVNVSKNMKRSFMLIESPSQKPRERTSSIHSVHKVAKSTEYSDVHSVEPGEICSETSSPSSKRELELNPETLDRRQKQIDYGKNTIGYERYSQIIPKHKRQKCHPKTPPKHLKLSRRAWDGLIRNWRLKLHKWDAASENEDFDLDSVNFDQYSFSSEVSSSYDSNSVQSDPSDSVPSTPKQSSSIIDNQYDDDELWNKKPSKPNSSKDFWSDCPQKSNKSDDDDYLGCEPLNENCVKACS